MVQRWRVQQLFWVGNFQQKTTQRWIPLPPTMALIRLTVPYCCYPKAESKLYHQEAIVVYHSGLSVFLPAFCPSVQNGHDQSRWVDSPSFYPGSAQRRQCPTWPCESLWVLSSVRRQTCPLAFHWEPNQGPFCWSSIPATSIAVTQAWWEGCLVPLSAQVIWPSCFHWSTHWSIDLAPCNECVSCFLSWPWQLVLYDWHLCYTRLRSSHLILKWPEKNGTPKKESKLPSNQFPLPSVKQLSPTTFPVVFLCYRAPPLKSNHISLKSHYSSSCPQEAGFFFIKLIRKVVLYTLLISILCPLHLTHLQSHPS